MPRLAFFVLLFPSSLLAADLPLGLVKDKPASGPFVETKQGVMVPYKAKIPGTDVEYEMVPVPGGKLKLGSPVGEKDRKEDEGPQVEVEIGPFWIGKYEVTWSEYKSYMAMHNLWKEMSSAKIRPSPKAAVADIVTAPSNLYDPTFTFSKGSEPRQPAISMSQYAAKQYTKWLSGISERFYRLPTEAEWEYACRAGTTTAYSFGDDAAQLGDHAWILENAAEVTHKVGGKKPNPWGLYDMHGNVAEWVLDGYAERYPDAKEKALVGEAFVAPTKLFPRVVRGGSYDDKPAACRSAARKKSDDDEWREQDPNFPQSPWWFTSNYGLCVGMRIVRPLEAPPRDQQEKYWKPDLQQIIDDVNRRIDEEGRGARGISDATLLQDIQKFQKK
jgi:formylglycine-generating enzyme required for sulfatase activity